MYSKNVIAKIIEYQAKGLSAEESRDFYEKEMQKKPPCLDTIYRMRKSPVGQEIIDEIIREQQRDIFRAQATQPALALKYRNELLKILIPERPETVINQTNITQNKVVNQTGAATSLDYSRALEEAARIDLQDYRNRKPLDTAPTPS